MIWAYTVDAILKEKGNPIENRTIGGESSRATQAFQTVTCIFELEGGNHYPLRLTNFPLDEFATGVGVTFLNFMNEQKNDIRSVSTIIPTIGGDHFHFRNMLSCTVKERKRPRF